jgi:hypothetical protein
LLVVGFVSSKEIDVEMPNEIDVGEEFEVVVKLVDFSEGSYDLKVDILGNDEKIARINGGSTHFYVKDIFEDGEARVSLEIVENFEGRADVIVKVRSSGGYSNVFDDYWIDVISSEIDEVVEEVGKVVNESSSEVVEGVVNKSVNEEESKEDGVDNMENGERDVISLTPQNIKEGQDTEIVFKAKNEIIMEYAIYGFAFFCVVLIVLLLIDKRD